MKVNNTVCDSILIVIIFLNGRNGAQKDFLIGRSGFSGRNVGLFFNLPWV